MSRIRVASSAIVTSSPQPTLMISGRFVALHQKAQRVGEIVHVQELAARRARAPHRDFGVARLLRAVELAQQRRQHVRGLQVEVVAGAIQVRRHHGDRIEAVLERIRLAHLDARDLGHGVPLVRRLERPGQQRRLRERLRREPRIDAARSQETELLRAVPVGGVDHVGLDQQIVADEVGRVRVVRDDAADLGRGHEHVGRPLLREEALDGGRVAQVDGCTRRADHVAEAARGERAAYRRAREAALAGDEHARVPVHSRCW